MNTKIIAVLMATIIAMAMTAMIAPMGAQTDPQSRVEIANTAPWIDLECTIGDITLKPCETGESCTECFGTTTVTIGGTLGDPNLFGDIASVTGVTTAAACTVSNCDWIPDATPTDGTFTCNLTCDCCTPDGPYTATVTVTDSAAATNDSSCDFNVLSTKGIHLDFTVVEYGTVEICKKKWVMGDDKMTTPGAPSVRSTGNNPTDVKISADPMWDVKTGTTYSIPANALDARVSGVPADPDGCLLDPPACFDIDLECCHIDNIDFSIHVPEGTPAGAYIGCIWIEDVSGATLPCGCP